MTSEIELSIASPSSVVDLPNSRFPNTVTTDSIVDGAVTGAKIADGTITDDKLVNPHQPLTAEEIAAILT